MSAAPSKHDTAAAQGCAEGCVLSALLLVIALPAAWWNGYVIATLWRWFVVPAFHLAPLSVGLAAGLSVLLSLVRPWPWPREGDEAKSAAYKFGETAARQAFMPATSLLIGWLIKTVIL